MPDTGAAPRSATPRPAVLGMTGPGRSAALLASRIAHRSEPAASRLDRTLRCPPPLRDDPALAAQVNDGLVDWMDRSGILHDHLDELREMNFGRLLMLGYPDADDPDRLLAVAKMVVSIWTADDHYNDSGPLGADPSLSGSRQGLAYAVVDPTALPARYARSIQDGLDRDPVRAAIRSAWQHLCRYADPVQQNRIRHQIAATAIACAQEASWRMTGASPRIWEYLVSRTNNSFRLCLSLIEPACGYTVPSADYSDPRLRRITAVAGLMSGLVNDLYSMARERAEPGASFDLPALIAAEEKGTGSEAVDRCIEIHNELADTLDAESVALAAHAALTGSAPLQRYLVGIQGWMGGNRAWHATSSRYQ